MHDLSRIVAERTGLSEEQARAALTTFLDEITVTLVREGRVQLDRFGVFELKVRKGRKGRNPRTGERVMIPETIRACFRPSQALTSVLDRLSQAAGKP
jgi:nucleoid DNA-binding protein